jgi:hypothetical protein
MLLLLRDSGIPVTDSQQIDRSLWPNYQIHISENLPSPLNNACSAKCNILKWSELRDSSITDTLDLDSQANVTWQESDHWLSETIVTDQVRNTVLHNLRRSLQARAIPWVQFAALPFNYKSVVNFRIDLDEPYPDDWQRVIKSLEPLEPAVTWFLSTKAGSQCPVIFDWLKGCDLQSHGHWHHIHCKEPKLNRINLIKAHRVLLERSITASGFAPPRGRISKDLVETLRAMGYHYLAGIGPPEGFLPVRGEDGLWRMHCQPVSEGLYLENDVNDEKVVIDGYLNAAERMIETQRPIFWYGHAERRLGRKPDILKELVNFALQTPGLWQISQSGYLTWLEARSKIPVTVTGTAGMANCLEVHWDANSLNPAPVMELEWEQRSWQVPLSTNQNSYTIRLSRDGGTAVKPIRAIRLKPEEVINFEGFRCRLKNWLDWERETPASILLQGSLHSQVKAVLRTWTDRSWHRTFQPKAWPYSDHQSEDAA